MATHTVVLDTLTQYDQPISKSIANANPDADDGVLKLFLTADKNASSTTVAQKIGKVIASET